MLVNISERSMSRQVPASDLRREVQNWGEGGENEQQRLMTELAGDAQSKVVLSAIECSWRQESDSWWNEINSAESGGPFA